MYDLTNRKVVYSLCDEFGFRFKKAFGQNFLTDASVLRAIAEAAGERGVLEIGPGFGTLTGYLAENAEKVVAVELVEVDGDDEETVARGHGHILHDGAEGIAQAASYACKKLWFEFLKD